MATKKMIEQTQPAIMTTTRADMWRVFVTGLVIGIALYALYIVLDRYVFTPVLCGETGGLAGRCEDKETYASVVSMLIAAVGGLFAMLRQRVYRPLFVVIFVTIALWGVLAVTTSLAWWLAALVLAVIVALGYTAFAWLALVRNFYIALGLSVVLLIVVRLVLVA